MKERWIRTAWSMAFLGLALGSAQADYAPLKIGNRWAYAGSLSVTAGTVSYQIQAREALTLEVLSQRQSGDTVLYRIRMRDSLYARKSRTGYADAFHDLPDTLLSQVLTYASLRDSVYQIPAAADSGALPDSNDLAVRGGRFSVFGSTHLLIAHRTLPGQPRAVPGTDPGKRVMQTQLIQSWTSSWNEWYVDDVGAFYEQFSLETECGPYLTRSLYLTGFNGKEVSIGATPPGWPLAKEGMIACSLARPPSSRSHIGFVKGEARLEADLTGRIYRLP